MRRSPVIRYPDRRLREQTTEIEEISPETHGSIVRLTSVLETLPNGVALAANQLGFKSRFFVIDRKKADRDDVGKTVPTVVMNPRIVSASDDRRLTEEGCLSFPGMTFQVPRSTEIEVVFSYLGETGLVFEKRKLSGFWAQVFQHEIEHLDGKTLIDFMPENKRAKVAMHLASRKAF